MEFYYTDQLEIQAYRSGEWLGELSLLYQLKCAASIIATTNGVLWMLDRFTFKHTCQTDWEATLETKTKALRAVSF